jgi:hypothetical protein
LLFWPPKIPRRHWKSCGEQTTLNIGMLLTGQSARRP